MRQKNISLMDVFRDKKIKPWFWIFTILYIGIIGGVIGYGILNSSNWHIMGNAQGFADLLFIFFGLPYMVIFIIYIMWVHRND